LGVKGKLDDVLKDEILELSQSSENFLVFTKGQDSDIYDFVLDENVETIMELLKIDEGLTRMFGKLVPKRNTE
jgi:hypothetical protein